MLLRTLAVLARAGALRPGVPRPAHARVLRQALRGSPNLAVQVALHAVARPGAPAVIDDRGVLSWRELDERVSRLANVLAEAPDGPVAVLLRNSREFVEAQLAAGRAGRPALLLNTWFAADEVASVVDEHRPGVIVADAELAPSLTGLPRDLPRVLAGPDGDYEAVLAAASAQAPKLPNNARIVILTSGTTGRPKGAERTSSMEALGHLAGFLERVPLRSNDRVLIAPPLFHAFGQLLLSANLVLGGTVVLPRRFDPHRVVELARTHHVTALGLVPVMLHRLAEVQGDLPGLHAVVVSGSPLPEHLREVAALRFGQVLYDLYGSTETGWVTIATPEDLRRRPGTVGRPGRGTAVLVVDEQDRPVPPGQPGRVYVRTGGEFEGYTGGEQRARLGDAVDTGDAGWLDEHGYLHLIGRADDTVITGGENVHPSEVEAVLDRHPELSESAVVGVPDAEYGQALAAFIVPRGGVAPDTEALRGFVRERLAGYKVPKHVVAVEELPRNATGKVLKRVLAEEFESPS